MPYKITALQPFGVIVEPKHAPIHVNELDIDELRELFLREQLVLLRGFETFEHSEQFADYCERWGEVSVWPFGRVLDLVQKRILAITFLTAATCRCIGMACIAHKSLNTKSFSV